MYVMPVFNMAAYSVAVFIIMYSMIIIIVCNN